MCPRSGSNLMALYSRLENENPEKRLTNGKNKINGGYSCMEVLHTAIKFAGDTEIGIVN